MSVYAGAARAVAKGALAEYWMTTRPADVVRPNYGDGPRARVSAERDAGPRGFAGTPWKMNGKTAALTLSVIYRRARSIMFWSSSFCATRWWKFIAA